MSYGKTDINECIEYFERRLGMRCDGGVKANRNYTMLLLKDMATQFPGSDPIVCVKRLVNIALSDDFWKTKTTNFGVIWFNRGRFILMGREQRKETPKSRFRIV
jgi:hypothetical protein